MQAQADEEDAGDFGSEQIDGTLEDEESALIHFSRDAEGSGGD